MGIVGEQFDVIDGAAVLAADALVFQRLLDGDGVGGEGVEVVAGDALAVSGDQKNQLPPQAMSPLTRPMPGTSTLTWRR